MDATGVTHRPTDLPPELWDRVIDHLHDDKDALKQTSLVCKAWTPSSHFHLFYHMLFSVLRPISRLNELVLTAPHIAACVKTLELWRPPADTLSLLDAPIILDAMPNLHTLKIFRIEMVADSVDNPEPRQPRTPRRLQRLEINASGMKLGRTVLLSFLSLFTSIELLQLSQLNSIDLLEESQSQVSQNVSHMLSQLAIRTLFVSLAPMDFVHQIVDKTRAAETLETLTLTSYLRTWEEIDQLGQILVKLCSTLRRLDAHPSVAKEDERLIWEPGPLWERMKLSQCASLETLNLTAYTTEDAYVTIKLVTAYLTAVKAVPQGLRDIVIYILPLPKSYDKPFDPDRVPGFWENLDKILLAHGPRDMTIALEAHWAEIPKATRPMLDEFKAFWTSRLPHAVERGRVRVMEKTLLKLERRPQDVTYSRFQVPVPQ